MGQVLLPLLLLINSNLGQISLPSSLWLRRPLRGLPEFNRGLIHWGQGAATRANDGRVTFDRHKVIRQGYNPFNDQPAESLSSIIDSLPATENNMWQLRKWRQVCKRWQLHVDSYTRPEGYWQRHLRKELQEVWLSLHHRAITLVKQSYVGVNIGGPYPRLHDLSHDLGEALIRYGFSRAFVAGWP